MLNIWGSTAGQVLMTFFISMVPVIELRGAIPIATANGLPLWAAIAVSIIGNLVPVPFIILFIRKIFVWMRTKSEKLNGLVAKLEARAERKSELVQRYAFWGLVVLVAIPLPGTGAWTGALVAAMMNMRLNRALPSIALGVAIAGMIVALVTAGAGSLLAIGA